MAEKEERILVLHGTGEYLCNKLNDDIPCENKYNCLECKLGISRSEVIERMAKAICASNMAPDCLWECETCDRWRGSDKEAAEAALNALLEEQK